MVLRVADGEKLCPGGLLAGVIKPIKDNNNG